MTIDLEETITDSLHSRADRPVDTDLLLAGATGRARVLRTRRRLVGAGALVAAVALTGAVVASAPSLLAGPLRPASPTGTGTEVPNAGITPPPPGGYHVPALPVAAGIPGAAARPDLVGTDPGVLHVDLTAETTGAYTATWTAAAGHESVDIGGTHNRLHLDLGPDLGKLDKLDRIAAFSDIWPSGATTSGPDPHVQPRRQLTVGGRPATLDETRYGDGASIFVVRWQPVAGLWARVESAGLGRAAVVAFAGKVRPALDRSVRCVAPSQVTKLPSGLRWTACGVNLTGYAPSMWSTRLTFTDSSGELMGVRSGEGRLPNADRVVNGHTATWLDGALTLEYPDFGDGGTATVEFGPGTPASEQAATRLGEVVELRGRPGQPDTWPAQPVS